VRAFILCRVSRGLVAACYSSTRTSVAAKRGARAAVARCGAGQDADYGRRKRGVVAFRRSSFSSLVAVGRGAYLFTLLEGVACSRFACAPLASGDAHLPSLARHRIFVRAAHHLRIGARATTLDFKTSFACHGTTRTCLQFCTTPRHLFLPACTAFPHPTFLAAFSAQANSAGGSSAAQRYRFIRLWRLAGAVVATSYRSRAGGNNGNKRVPRDGRWRSRTLAG